MHSNSAIQKPANAPHLRIPPHSIEAEQSVLGVMLSDNQGYESIIEGLTASDFYNRAHQIIFDTCLHLVNNNQPSDQVTVAEQLHAKDLLDKAGGYAYLQDLCKNTPSSANAKGYADIIIGRANTRHLIGAAHSIADQAYNTQGKTANELIEHAQAQLFTLRQSRKSHANNMQSMGEVVGNTIDNIIRLTETGGGLTGLSTGFNDLDNKTNGLQSADLIIVAARPSMGKTTFAMNLAEHALMTTTKPVIVFSIEMPDEQIMMRLLASMSRVDMAHVRSGQLDDKEWARLANAMATLKARNNLFIDDASTISLVDMRSRARRIISQHGDAAMIAVDYLQLILPAKNSQNRTEQISQISRDLKALAKEFNVPVVALSQLNRGLEQRTDKRPINSDLRESGSIEQDADLIIFLYRDEVYHEDSSAKGLAEAIIGKQRNGPIGTTKLTFQGQYSRFDNHKAFKDNQTMIR